MPKRRAGAWNHTIRNYGSRVVVSPTDRTRLEVRAWIVLDGERRDATCELPAGASFVAKSAAVAELHAKLRREARGAARAARRQTEMFDA